MSSTLASLRNAPWAFTFAIASVSLVSSSIFAQQSTLTLVDGMTLGPGMVGNITAMTRKGSINNRAEVQTKPITFMDDGLRIVHVCGLRTVNNPPSPGLLRITFSHNESETTSDGTNVVPVSGIATTTPFDPFGRRFYLSPLRGQGVARFVQGITEITPSYVKVEALKTEKDKYRWDMRLSLDSLDSDTLISILSNNADRDKPGDWLDIVNLFAEAKRFFEARHMLKEAIYKFPELENQKSQLKQFDQLMADQLFEAALNAQQAHQWQYSRLILSSINKPALSLETQLKLEARLQELDALQSDQNLLLQTIEGDISKMPDGDTKLQFQSLLPEIAKYLSPSTNSRFSDYIRRRTDIKLRPEQLSAIAMSGWLFGPTVGEDNPLVVASGIKARSLISEYLAAPNTNNQIVEELTRLEAGNARLVSKILEFMPPPVSVPEAAAVSTWITAAGSEASEQSQTEVRIPGRYLLEVPRRGKNLGETTRYLVQLPPEYNPYQKYPCVLTLPSEYSNIQDQVNWWTGPFNPNSPDQRCVGQATKRGYIVVSPDWMQPKQPAYNFTENEHANVLDAFRDALKRFSIDTDRVYISGHYAGATAAWDIALAHPDMWAGLVCVGPAASKYIIQYWNNALYVPSYFVTGEFDPDFDSNAGVWDKFFDRKQIDTLVSVYRGRGMDHYQEELSRIMDWLSLPSRVRNRPPESFEVTTSRAGDRFFWWFETGELTPNKLVHPLLYKADSEYKIESSRSVVNNSVRMKTVPAKRYSIFLTPEVVDFSRSPISVGDRKVEAKPDLRIMLEDARGRADRQHPFWMRVDFGK
jgi:pimeloyl-ACP methyl ester carboxylesterase